MKKKIVLFLLLITLVLSVGACSKKRDSSSGVELDEEALDNVNETDMPIVKEPIELNIFAGRAAESAKDWNDVMIFNEYEEMTNIDVKWEMVPSDSLEEKRNLRLASDHLPDAFHSAGMPNSDLMKYGEQGVFIPLNDLIDEYAPNLKKIFEGNPEVEKALTFPDGKIYSFPTIYSPDFLSVRLGPRPWINQEWLDALDMEMPETTEAFYEYLKAVKEQDPNGNGEADEIPFGSYSVGTLLRWLNGSFGLVNRGFNHPYVDMVPNGEGMRFVPTSDAYKEMLEYVHKLFKEELIEQNIYSLDPNQYLANGSDGKYGSTVSHSPADLFSGNAGKAFAPAHALEGPYGDRLITGVAPTVASKDGFVITSENPNPAATVRWMDYFYSDEGAKLFFMGVEGETYEETADGEVEYLDKITNSSEGLSFEQELAKYITWPGGGYPGIVKEEFFKGLESSPESLEAAELLEKDVIDEVWPSFVYTKEENKDLASLGSDIEKYVGEMQDKFVAGDASFEEWDDYVETIEKMGLERYMEIQKDAYERYQDN